MSDPDQVKTQETPKTPDYLEDKHQTQATQKIIPARAETGCQYEGSMPATGCLW